MGAALVFSRWLLFPRFLIHFDQINFAFSIHQFNPGLHQPQPPGFPLFVGLLKLLSLFIPGTEAVFLAAALVMSAASLFLIRQLCERIVGPKRGFLGVLLFLFHPAFWLAALTNQVRLAFAFGALLVALCAWTALQKNSSRWYALAAASLGFAAGFRPGLAVIMAPLLLFVAWRIGLRWKAAVVSALCFAVAVATWFPSLMLAAGGLKQYQIILRAYAEAQFPATSPMFGASAAASLHMAWEAVVWSCLGILSWAWAAIWAARRLRRACDRSSGWFLAFWFVPGLCFYAIFHVGDPDHTLGIVPATCVAGALALNALLRGASRRKTAAMVGACVLLNLFLFLKPISKTAKPSTYAPVRWRNAYVSDVIGGVRALRSPGPLTAIFDDGVSEWRHFSYYEPGADVIVVEHGPDGSPIARHLRGNRITERSRITGPLRVPACGTLAVIDPFVAPLPSAGTEMRSIHHRVFVLQGAPGQSYYFRGVHFLSAPEGCGAAQ